MKIEDVVSLRQTLTHARHDAEKAGVEWQQAMSEFLMQVCAFFPADVLETSELRLRLTPDGFMFMMVKVNKDSEAVEEKGYDVC